MKNLLYTFFFFLSAGLVHAQNIEFTFDVDNSDPALSIVSIYATGTSGSGNGMIGFSINVYYDDTEASFNPSSVDYSGAEAFGWFIDANSFATDNEQNPPNPSVPIEHNAYAEMTCFDGTFAGGDVPEGPPTLFFTITFDRTPGDGDSGGQVYLGGFDTKPSLEYLGTDFNIYPVNAAGTRTMDLMAPLPVELVAFDVEKKGERSSYLTWNTVSEINTSHFAVQRSFDKRNWQTIGNVDAAGTSQIVQSYGYVDENVYNGIDNRLAAYYRLHMVDLDGQFKNSPIRSVVFGTDADVKTSFASTVYPNPTSDGVYVEWTSENIDMQPTSIELYDVSGKLILQHDVAPESSQEYIDFTPVTLNPGLYLIRMVDGLEPLANQQIVVGQRR